MKVKLISHSQAPLANIGEPEDWDSMLDIVAFCARVSNPSNQMNKESIREAYKISDKASTLVSIRNGVCVYGS